MKYKYKNDMKISDIKSIIEYSINPVVEVYDDISIDESMGIFEKNINSIIIKTDKNSNMLLFDKDILLELMLKRTDIKKSIFEFASKDYCLIDNRFGREDVDCKFIVVRDSENKVKGVFRENILKKLSVALNTQQKVIKNIIKRNFEDNNLDITIGKIMPLKKAKNIVERELITKVMNNVKSTYKAAEILEVSQATIARKAKKYNDEIYIGDVPVS